MNKLNCKNCWRNLKTLPKPIAQDDSDSKILYFGVFIVHSLYLTDLKNIPDASQEYFYLFFHKDPFFLLR